MSTSPHSHSVAQSVSKMTSSIQSQHNTEANQPQHSQQLSYPNHHQHPRQSQQELQQPILQNHLPSRKGSSGSNHSHVRTCKTEGHNVSATVCANCGTTTTPLWRRAPTGETICNACGLYLKARNTVRPPWLKRNTIKKASPTTPDSPESTSGTCPGDGHCDGTGGSTSCHGCPAYNQHQVNRQALICANCGTNTTPLWRRDEAGNTICNACGLYFKLHNVHRPVTMKRSVIKRRKRVTLATSPPPTTHHHQRHHSGNSDNEHPRKNRIQHPPTPASSSGSERGYFSSEDEVCSNDSYTSSIGQKRKHVINHTANKRQCGNNRSVPAIEDYISINHHGDNVYSAVNERRRSLSPVEPTLNPPQVQIHSNNNSNNNNGNNGLSSGRIMGTPSIPLISAYPKNKKETNNFQSGPEGSNSYAMSSSPISALLNPTSPTTSAPQLPPISSIPPPSGHHAAQGYPAPLQTAPMADPNITQQLLQAHRQELQREVSHLSMLLNRTTAILVGLDQAMNANESSTPPPNGPSPLSLPPLASDANTTSALASLFALQNNNGNHYTAHHQQQSGMSTSPVSGTPVQQPYMTLPPPTSLASRRSQSVSSDRV